MMNGVASDAMRQTADYRVNYGVEIPRLQSLCNTLIEDNETNDTLIDALWKERVRECRILALMLAGKIFNKPLTPQTSLTPHLWITDIKTIEMARYAALYLFQYLPDANKIITTCEHSDDAVWRECARCTRYWINRPKKMDSEIINEFSLFLEKHNLRKTPERFAILEKIITLNRHFTADELHQLLMKEFRVSRGTVYNNLHLLEQAHLIARTLSGDSIQYEIYNPQQPHLHVICTQCGRVRELAGQEVIDSLRHLKTRQFKPHLYSVNIYGLCSKCKRKIKKDTPTTT